MGDRRIKWAFEQPVKPVSKLVLVYLASISDKAGTSSPTEKDLAINCSMTTSAVYSNLSMLETDGLVERSRPPGGRRTIHIKAEAA